MTKKQVKYCKHCKKPLKLAEHAIGEHVICRQRDDKFAAEFNLANKLFDQVREMEGKCDA